MASFSRDEMGAQSQGYKDFIGLKKKLEAHSSSTRVHLYKDEHAGNTPENRGVEKTAVELEKLKLHSWREQHKHQKLHVSVQGGDRQINVIVSQREDSPSVRLETDIAANNSLEKEKKTEDQDQRIERGFAEIANLLKMMANEGDDTVVVDRLDPERLQDKAITALLTKFDKVHYKGREYSLDADNKLKTEPLALDADATHRPSGP